MFNKQLKIFLNIYRHTNTNKCNLKFGVVNLRLFVFLQLCRIGTTRIAVAPVMGFTKTTIKCLREMLITI